MLFNCTFISNQFNKCSFYSAHFKNVIFGNVSFFDCNFEFVVLEDCNFSNCVFDGEINFNYAYVESKEWLITIINTNEKLIKIFEQYIISENTVNFKDKNYYQLIDKSLNTTIAVERQTLQNKMLFELENKILSNTLINLYPNFYAEN